MIRAEEMIDVERQANDVFRFLDDEANTPKWNPRCVQVKRVDGGEKRIGSKLLYHYKEPGRTGTMDGEVTAYEPGRTLVMRFADKTMTITVAFALVPSGGGTRVHHHLEVETKGFLMKLMTPLIRAGIRKQAADELRGLKAALS